MNCKYCKHETTSTFCSRECKGQYYKFRKRGNSKNESNINKARIYSKLANHYGEVCMVPKCGWNECLELHRLVPGKIGGIYSKENCVILCPNHHALITNDIETLSSLIPRLKLPEEI